MAHICFPPEWYPQSGIQLTWPHQESDWAYMLDEITCCFSEIAHQILKRQKLVIVCKDKSIVMQALGSDYNKENLSLVEIPSNDTWARDHAGISVLIDGEPTLYDFTFNGWGLKFASNFDNQLNKSLFEQGIFARNVTYSAQKQFVLEGGSIESDGEGSILTTSECLLSPNRNPFLTKQAIETFLKNTLGAKRVLWLDHGFLEGDDTDSHVDTLARFCDNKTIAYVKCDNTQDKHFEALKKMEDQLKTFVDFEGNPYTLIPLPMATPVFFDGEQLPATYANFLIMNDAVLLPTYNNKETDDLAIQQLTIAFPQRQIVPVDCSAVIKQNGSLHCLTMQYPKEFVN